LVPRILSPAYFHHYNAQTQPGPSENETNSSLLRKHEQGLGKSKEKDAEQLVLGVGPVQKSFWRLSRLVPLEGLRRQFSTGRERGISSDERNSLPDSLANTLIEEEVVAPQLLEIQEGSDGISLKPLPEADKHSSEVPMNGKTDTKNNVMTGDEKKWGRGPYLPSYVPFGQVCDLIQFSFAVTIDSIYVFTFLLFHGVLLLHVIFFVLACRGLVDLSYKIKKN